VTPLEAALAYASWGWPVLPIVPNGKLPATQHGVNDATTDEATIRRWFEGHDDRNVGIACGAASGLVVFDIDPRNGGDDSWSSWTDERGAQPDGAVQLTAGGGQHYLAAYVDGVKSCKLRDGIDLLSDGRYFVAFPSRIEGREYRWELSSDPFEGVAPMGIPARWLEGIEAKRRQPVALTGDGSLITGNRNNGLHRLAGLMRRYGMGEPEILAALSVTNETRCDVPLPASELRQLVHSASRYEVEHDVAANAALSDDVAGFLPPALETAPSDYFLTRATSFLSQPAPLEWAVKRWVPASGTTMVFGESGAGKTFVTLDLACSIAAGRDWMGNRTKRGVVVYLAGEGNYGIRQRVAAWCRHHGVEELDNLLISNKGIDLDSASAAAQIIAAVRELTDADSVIVVIDTVNNHMSGDENAARDVRNFFNAANVVASALRSAVVLNHHVGHGEGAKGRARGSSAFKASLDASIMVSKADDGAIELSCVKMKDAEAPAPMFGRLEPVALGWVDEDGEEIKGAVFVPTEAPPPRIKVDGKLAESRSSFERAWWDSGCELRNGAPYLSRSALREHMMKNKKSESYIRQAMKPSGGKFIQSLTDSGIIAEHEHGWIVCDNVNASGLLIALRGVVPDGT
jgi:AAA domain/Bifunctional DNA primase/polymerase, N-terminal/Primase C terminal 1 (PriCT-1)